MQKVRFYCSKTEARTLTCSQPPPAWWCSGYSALLLCVYNEYLSLSLLLSLSSMQWSCSEALDLLAASFKQIERQRKREADRILISRKSLSSFCISSSLSGIGSELWAVGDLNAISMSFLQIRQTDCLRSNRCCCKKACIKINIPYF